MKEIEKERRERRKIRRRTKKAVEPSSSGTSEPPAAGASASEPQVKGDVKMADVSASASASASAETGTAVGAGEGAGVITNAQPELEEESVYVEKEQKEIMALVDEDVRKDVGASFSALYDLYGGFFLFWFSCYPISFALGDSFRSSFFRSAAIGPFYDPQPNGGFMI